jgi:DNA-3-methyladenine glycosylase
MKQELVSPDFFDRSPAIVARDLLGMHLCRKLGTSLLRSRITETEAYLAEGDAASHSAVGVRPRNRWMFGPPGSLYVFTIHARFCLNAVTESEGIGSAVLIRSLEPLEGIELMKQRRQREKTRELTCGPARLCEAYGIDLSHNGLLLYQRKQLWLESPNVSKVQPTESVEATPRIGLSKAKELPLRFILKGNSFLSRSG